MSRGMNALEPNEWLIGLSNWVLEDGNYEDFAVGQRRRFALEFYGDIASRAKAARSAVAIGDGRYDIEADVAFSTEDLIVLDFGLFAYSTEQRPAVGIGTWYGGSVSLDVDHYVYFEQLYKRQGIPPAIYTWSITGVWGINRQPTRAGWRARLTWWLTGRGWTTLDGTADAAGRHSHFEYLLRCRLEDEPPTYRL